MRKKNKVTHQRRQEIAKKGLLHPRNLHQGRYDLIALSKTCPELKKYCKAKPNGDMSIDFSHANAVLCLNKALLAHFYHVTHWCIPAGYLCPPIPGRADYIHYIADLLATSNQGKIPTDKNLKVLDIGTGANCIYPIIGSQSYGWQFIATDIDPRSIKSAKLIAESNGCLSQLIKVIPQSEKQKIFTGIINDEDRFDLSLCNPPFNASLAEAQFNTQRKLQNLNKGKLKKSQIKRNFAGQETELCYPGGEINFLTIMANESKIFSEQVYWFSSLVSKNENIRPLKKRLIKLGARQIEVIEMSQGQKISRLIAWSFLSIEQQQKWAQERWN